MDNDFDEVESTMTKLKAVLEDTEFLEIMDKLSYPEFIVLKEYDFEEMEKEYNDYISSNSTSK